MAHKIAPLPEIIDNKIFIIRGHKVLLSAHLAELYGVEARSLVQAVKRNKDRFPGDFLFQLTHEELSNLKSQIVISSWGGRRANPYAFTEQGVAMLSSVLRSKRAVQVNIAIMRAFVKLRELLASNKNLAVKLEELEKKVEKHDEKIRSVFQAIRQLMAIPSQDDNYKRTKIGYIVDNKRSILTVRPR